MAVKQWEYLVLPLRLTGKEAEQGLNSLGTEGWELIAIWGGGGTYPCSGFLKREKN